MKDMPDECIDLIYIDPPYYTQKDFYTKDGRLAFSDKWESLEAYLEYLGVRIRKMKRLLKPTGSIYVHLDWRASHYVKVEMDKIFGANNFRNEIVWKRRAGKTSTSSNMFEAITDTIFRYSKTNTYQFRVQHTKSGTESYVRTRFKYTDTDGRLYRLSPLNSPNLRPNLQYVYKGYEPHQNGWSVSRETMEEYDRQGKLFFPKDKGKRIQRKQYLDEWKGRAIQSLWADIAPINPQAFERLGYPTQKPEALLNRIIKASSNEGDLVADFFCGSGTALVIAKKFGRHWIGCDQSGIAVETTKRRLQMVQVEMDLTK